MRFIKFCFFELSKQKYHILFEEFFLDQKFASWNIYAELPVSVALLDFSHSDSSEKAPIPGVRQMGKVSKI